jgi:orotate phosphoribosyltransferase
MDARQTTFDGTGAWTVGAAIAPLVAPEAVAVGGLTMGADPVALATAIVSTQSGRPLSAFSIRKTEKEHGTGGRVVGPVASGDAVCLVEDTTTTGGAFLEALDAALHAGLHVIQAICLFDRSEGIVANAMASHHIPYQAVLQPADLGVEP